MTTTSTPPEYTLAGQLQAALGVFVLDASGNIVSTFGGGSSGSSGTSGSATAAGTSGSLAQAVQGITGGVPIPVSNASLPLPTGAATSALQPALNADGGAASHVTNFPLVQTVLQAGSTGTDYSASAATVPTGTPLVTIPATAGRAFVEVQNQSVGNLQLVRDDGTGANQTTIIMAPAATAGGQGGGWSSATFKGRIRVFGAAGAQVAAYQE